MADKISEHGPNGRQILNGRWTMMQELTDKIWLVSPDAIVKIFPVSERYQDKEVSITQSFGFFFSDQFPRVLDVFDAVIGRKKRARKCMVLERGSPVSLCNLDRKAMGDLVKCLRTMHLCNLAHNDIKLSNFVWLERGGVPTATIIDFGKSKIVQDELAMYVDTKKMFDIVCEWAPSLAREMRAMVKETEPDHPEQVLDLLMKVLS